MLEKTWCNGDRNFPIRLSDFMQFIELAGKTLLEMQGVDGLSVDDLKKLGMTDVSVVRINRQGDIELRRADRWDVIGGLLGDYEHRLRSATGMEWV